MPRRTSQLIYLLVGSLILVACTTPTPNVSHTPTRAPLKPVPTPFSSAAWQFWPAAALSQGVFDVARGEQFMWIATSFGVVRLDPVTRTYTSFDQLGQTLRVFPIADNAVYAGTMQGVYYFDGQVWSRITFTSAYPVLSDSVTAFGLDLHGDLWMLDYVSRASRLYQLTGHVPSVDPWPASLPDGLATPAPPLFPFNQPDCGNWPVLATYTYSYRTPEECLHYRQAYTLLEKRGGYGPYAAEADDSVWWLFNDQLLHLSAEGATLSTHPLSGSGHLASDPQHGVWIAANDEGLLYATDAEVQHVSIGLEKYTLFAPLDLAIDQAGVVWAGTNRGTERLNTDTQQWQLIDQSQESGSPAMPLVAASIHGTWFSDGQELVHYDGHNFVTVWPPTQGDRVCLLNLLRSDQTGHVWTVSSGAYCGVLEFDPTLQEWRQHLSNQLIYEFDIGTDDTLIALNSEGQLLAHFSTAADWKMLAQIENLSDLSIVADNHGGAWAGFHQAGEIWHYQAGLDHPVLVRAPTSSYFKLAIDRQAQLWLSTRDQLMRYDGQTWQTVNAPPLGLINALETAPDGRLWFAGERGVAAYDPTLDK